MSRENHEKQEYAVIHPTSDAEWDKYFDLRWRVLRSPWMQPRGSERDDREDDSIHLMISDAAGAAVAVGRAHFISATDAQIRYMAVDPGCTGRGLGGRVLSELEKHVKSRGATRIVLNARSQAIPFYLKHHYVKVGPADTLFGVIEHVRMEKRLT